MGRASSQMKEHFIASLFGCYGPSCLRASAFLFLNLLSSTGRAGWTGFSTSSFLTQLEERRKFSPSRLLFVTSLPSSSEFYLFRQRPVPTISLCIYLIFLLILLVYDHPVSSGTLLFPDSQQHPALCSATHI